MKRTLNSRLFTGLADLIESYGHNPDEVAKSVGIKPDMLRRSGVPVTVEQYSALVEAAALVCGDEFFLLQLAERQSWRLLGPIESVLERAGTVGETLVLLSKFVEQNSQGLFLYLEQDDSGVSLCFEVRDFNSSNPPQLREQLYNVDLAMAVSCRELQQQLGRDWRPDFTQFQYTAPAVQSRLRRIFGDKLHFNQDVNCIHLSNENLNHSFSASKLLPAIEMPSTRECDTTVSMPFILRVDRTIRLLVNRGECSANLVASTLAIKLRTLQYKLQQEGNSYQVLYDAVRLDIARNYLNNSDLPVGAISERLQFTDSAAFSNFFKLRAGCTPRACRNEFRKLRA